MGSVEAIAQEKREVFAACSAGAIGIINGDQELLTRHIYAHPIVTFGFSKGCMVNATDVRMTPQGISCMLRIKDESLSLLLPTQHYGMLTNALAAAATAWVLGIPVDVIVTFMLELNSYIFDNSNVPIIVRFLMFFANNPEV